MQRKVQNNETSIVACLLVKGVTLCYLATNGVIVMLQISLFLSF